MSDVVLHPQTELEVGQFLTHPSHGLLIIGPSGIGKKTLARRLSADLLQTDAAKIDTSPYLRILNRGEDRSIAIEKIRELEHFLSRKVPGDSNRVIIIEDAQFMTIEAQNALLKTLEEPPAHTTLILTTPHEKALLATISSRTRSLVISRPSATALQAHFAATNFSEKAIRQAALMSGGLPGLMSAILRDDNHHPLMQAAATAREIVQKTTFERLAMVEPLSKQRDLCIDVLNVLQQMAHISISSGKPTITWQKILTHCYAASTKLRNSAQPKLVLLDLMLNL